MKYKKRKQRMRNGLQKKGRIEKDVLMQEKGQGQDSPKLRNKHQHQPKITRHLNQMMKRFDEKVGTVEEIVVVLEEEEEDDDVLSRLEIQTLEYLQDQEETKSEVLGNDMNRTMEEMMEEKLTERFDQIEAEWEHKASNEAIKISEQVDRVTQLEHKVSTQAEEVFKVIREATATLNTLETILTLAQDRIKEVDQAAEAIADFIDASTVANNEYIQNAHTIMKQAKQKLYDTRNTLIAEMVSAPNPTTVNTARKEIQQVSQKAIKEIRAEQDMTNISIDDKMRAIQEDLQRRSDQVTDKYQD
jgi:hypothetical protein